MQGHDIVSIYYWLIVTENYVQAITLILFTLKQYTFRSLGEVITLGFQLVKQFFGLAINQATVYSRDILAKQCSFQLLIFVYLFIIIIFFFAV